MKSFAALLTATFVFTTSFVLADQVKGVDVKQLFSNEKATGSIFTLQPGATAPSTSRPGARVVYFIQGSTIERIYDDGKMVQNKYKTGDTAYFDQPEDQAPYAFKNVGKSVFKAYVVTIK